MIRKMKAWLATIVVLLGSISASAADFEVDGICYNVTSSTDLTVEVTSGNVSYTGSVIIPDKVASYGIAYSVTSIRGDAFYGCSSLTSIVFPEGLTSIGSSAFHGCSGLTSITLPEGLTSIGRSAFSGCSGLTSISVALDNPIYDSRNNCNAIIQTSTNSLLIGCKNTTIPESVTSVGSDAFSYCHGLTSITLPEGLTSIGERAFSGCSGLTSITLPEGLKSIGSYAFSGCSGLTSIVLPEGLTWIGSSPFSSCSALTSISVALDNPIYDSRNNSNAIIQTSTNSLLIGCKNTTIPESVTSIGNYAFRFCSGLTSITLPEGLTSIGGSAFYGCSSLTSIVLPEGLTSIGGLAFYGCIYEA